MLPLRYQKIRLENPSAEHIMKCPVCGTKNEVGKLYEWVRAGKTLTRYYCSACSVEFSTVESNVATILVIDADGREKKLIVNTSQKPPVPMSYEYYRFKF